MSLINITMKLKSLDIGRLTTKNNLFFAPMAGFSDYAFRSLAARLGAGMCVTEMVSAKGLYYNNENTKDLLFIHPSEGCVSVQIFGSDPKIMRFACESEYLKEFDVVDINMGCPVHKIYSNGEGSRLMEDMPLAEKIVSECVKSGKTITVKFRAGIYENNLCAVEFAKRLEGAGASLITLHGRTKEGLYSGKVHFDEIERVKKSVKIPVIANGGIFTLSDANEMMDKTGADGVAIARGGVFNPLLFSEISGESSNFTIKDCAFYLIDLRKQNFSDKNVAHGLRKTLVQLLKGVRGAKDAKLKIFNAESTNELKEILNEVL